MPRIYVGSERAVAVGLAVHRWFSTCLTGLGDLVFPWQCAVCAAEGQASPFCEGCRDELREAAASRSCMRCAMPIGPWTRPEGPCMECRKRALGFDSALALGPYQGPVRALCLQLKHERNQWLARWLVDVLVEAKAEAILAQEPACVVPVPMHWRRQWSRGHDQAQELAAHLARRLGLGLRRPLRRVRATPKLASRGRTERLKLLKGAFAVRNDRGLRGETVLLVDDILTTGATCGAAARALKRAGAKRVAVAVIGRAEGRV